MHTKTTVSFFARLHQSGIAYYGFQAESAKEAGPLYKVVVRNPPNKLLSGKHHLTHQQHSEWLASLRESGSSVVVKELRQPV